MYGEDSVRDGVNRFGRGIVPNVERPIREIVVVEEGDPLAFGTVAAGREKREGCG